MRPELGRTQYCFGAVVLTLKATGSLFGETEDLGDFVGEWALEAQLRRV